MHCPFVRISLLTVLVACSAPEPGRGGANEPGAVDPVADDVPTWHGDIRPLLADRCGSCHGPDRVAGFSFETYSVASALADVIADAVVERRMPPWGAFDSDECAHPAGFTGDRSLSQDEIDRIAEWAAAGAPAGDPVPAPDRPEVPTLDRVDFSYTVDRFRVPIDEPDPHHCFYVHVPSDEPVWITGAEIIPSGPALHHVIIGIDKPDVPTSVDFDEPCNANVVGHTLGGWVPGADPIELPDDVGVKLKPGMRLRLQFHWHPGGEVPDPDTTEVRLRFAEEEPGYAARIYFSGNATDEEGGLLPGPADEDGPEFFVPADATDHVETMVRDAREGFLFAGRSHMHWRGTEQLTTLIRSDGSEDCLLHEPAWDYDWQTTYTYDQPIEDNPWVEDGDQLRIRCTYDNSLDNPFVADFVDDQQLDGPVDAEQGEGADDEMCLFIYGVARPN